MSRKKFTPLLYLLSTNPAPLTPSKSSLFTSCHPLLKGYESYLTLTKSNYQQIINFIKHYKGS